MAKSKSLIQKAIDGVDHMIHPDQENEKQDLENNEQGADQSPTTLNNGTQSLRKFDKFKTTGVKAHDE